MANPDANGASNTAPSAAIKILNFPLGGNCDGHHTIKSGSTLSLAAVTRHKIGDIDKMLKRKKCESGGIGRRTRLRISEEGYRLSTVCCFSPLFMPTSGHLFAFAKYQEVLLSNKNPPQFPPQ